MKFIKFIESGAIMKVQDKKERSSTLEKLVELIDVFGDTLVIEEKLLKQNKNKFKILVD
jgi:hypothetical protein